MQVYMQSRYGLAVTNWQVAMLLDWAWDDCDLAQPGFALAHDDGEITPVPAPLPEADDDLALAPGPVIIAARGNGKSHVAQAVLHAIRNGMMTVNQARAANGLPALVPAPARPQSASGGMTAFPPAVKSSQVPAGMHNVHWSAQPPGIRGQARGMPGFDGHGRREIPLELPAVPDVIPDVFGVVRGYRWWTLDAPPLWESPAHAEQVWKRGLLRGMQAAWQPGENTAICRAGAYKMHPDTTIPDEECGCGFWAYWKLQPHDVGQAGLPVCGVVEGYGAVLPGTRGFRAAKARIVALHLPFRIVPLTEPDDDPLGLGLPAQVTPGRHNPWYNHPKFRGRVINIGIEAPVPLQPVPEPSQDEIRAAEDAAEAWTAVIGDRLAQMYPGARVFETRAAMEAAFPPDLSQVPQEVMCLGCGRSFATSFDLNIHQPVPGYCPDRK